jgi:hypothetical protein
MGVSTNNHQLATYVAPTLATNMGVGVQDKENLTVSLGGTATSYTINFQGALEDGVFFDLAGTSLSDPTDFAFTTSILGQQGWNFDVSVIDLFRVQITAISGGSVIVSTKIIR